MFSDSKHWYLSTFLKLLEYCNFIVGTLYVRKTHTNDHHYITKVSNINLSFSDEINLT